MKILFLHKWLIIGGIERVLVNYLDLLKDEKDLNISVLIAYEDQSDVFKTDIPEKVNLTYLFNKQYCERVQDLKEKRKNSIFNKLKYKVNRIKEKNYCKYKLHKFIDDNKFDLIINFSNHFDPYINFESLNIPIVRWQHLALKEEQTREVEKEIVALKKYDRIVSICEDMSKQIIKRAGIKEEKIKTIYNPLDFNKIRLQSERTAQHCINKYMVQVARLDKIKKHDILIEIYSELVKRGIKENLYIIGDGPEKNNLQRLIEQLGLQNRCFLLGEIKNPYPYMKNATLFLHTSEREGLPTVLIESLILGVPVVAMDCPTGPREILNDGKCGVLIPMGKKREFIEAVMMLLSNHNSISNIKKEIKEHVLCFDRSNTKKQFMELIKH